VAIEPVTPPAAVAPPEPFWTLPPEEVAPPVAADAPPELIAPPLPLDPPVLVAAPPVPGLPPELPLEHPCEKTENAQSAHVAASDLVGQLDAAREYRMAIAYRRRRLGPMRFGSLRGRQERGQFQLLLLINFGQLEMAAKTGNTSPSIVENRSKIISRPIH
jgi:hypothetical protein